MRITIFWVVLIVALAPSAIAQEAIQRSRVGSTAVVADDSAIERKGLAVTYRLAYSTSPHFPGYQLTLMFRDIAGIQRHIEPRVLLQAEDGMVLQPVSGERLEVQAAIVAHTPVPVIPPPPPTYAHQGTITLPSGQTATYSGTSRPQGGFAEGFARGQAVKARRQAIQDREEGALMGRWLANWLKRSYTLPAGDTVSGWLLYPDRHSPSKLTVEVDGERYEFNSVTLGR